MTAPTVHLLDPAVRDYAWGSRTQLAQLRGDGEVSPTPEAEAWFGAHPVAPAATATGPDLRALVAADPDHHLGADVVARFGAELPFLVKLLAADAPLSLQVHPSADRAVAGFDAEEAAGVPRDAPTRIYRDDRPKPELLLALTSFSALCGFRDPAATVALLDALDVPALSWLRRTLADRGEPALADLVARALRPRPELTEELAALRPALDRVAGARGEHALNARWLAVIAERYPSDGGVLVALLLRLVDLAPGQAIHLPAGTMHAYLAGAGLEVMAASDNVVRGGLTVKHVDVEELLRVVDAAVLPTPLVHPEERDGWRLLPTPTGYFEVSHRPLAPTPVRLDRDDTGPEVLVVIGGEAHVVADGDEVVVPPAGGVYLSAAARDVVVAGDGTLYRTTVGRPSGPAGTRRGPGRGV